jgi:hypothetical protein
MDVKMAQRYRDTLECVIAFAEEIEKTRWNVDIQVGDLGVSVRITPRPAAPAEGGEA